MKLFRWCLVGVLVLILYKSCNEVTRLNELKHIYNSPKEDKSTCLKAALVGILYFEGIKPEKYTCPAGKKTQGIGLKPSSDGDLSIDHMTKEFLLEFIKILRNVKNKNPKLDDCQAYALTSFYYNVTPSPKSKIEEYLKQDSFNLVGLELQRYVYHDDPKTNKKIKSKGLMRRREFEKLLFNKDEKLDSLISVMSIKIQKEIDIIHNNQ